MNDPISPYQHATALQAQGLQVLPARHAHANKGPIVKWKTWQNRRITDKQIGVWFTGKPALNYWVLCGKLSGVVVLDTDTAEGEQWWRDHGLGDIMDKTAVVKTSKGHHFWFRIPKGWTKTVQGWAVHPDTHETDNVSFDFRAEGGGVLAPPSQHETGITYTWLRPFEEMQDAPTELLGGSYRKAAPDTRKALRPNAEADDGFGGAAEVVTSDGNIRSLLVNLLKNPPAKGGRNAWMARVAGHYAAEYRGRWDLYELHCQQANATCTPPMSRTEFDKTIRSVWEAETGKSDTEIKGLTQFKAENGWIRGTGRRLMTQTRSLHPDTGDAVFDVEEWANFDIMALGISETDEGGEADYWVRLLREVGPVEAVLPGRVLGDNAKLTAWLASMRVSILPPDNRFPREGAAGTRIARYLESQSPPAVRITRVLGWDKTILAGQGGFVTHDGVLTAKGAVAFEDAGIRPDPLLRLRGVAAHHYGHSKSKREARRVLREVLTFQEETVCSVFGAWWAACLLKPQLERETSLFPFMAIEAPSESGKTTGFFGLMVQLAGNTRGETVPTFAALRNMAAAHRNGVVWVDDLDDPGHLMELLRAATAGGTLTKMGDSKAGAWTATADSQIVAPIVLSGESLGMEATKALRDRAVELTVPSPVHRRSLHDPKVSQQEDILTLRREYPNGLSALSGWVVELALKYAPEVIACVAESRGMFDLRGRFIDKNAILLAGAKLLDALTATSADDVTRAWAGGGDHYPRVLAWVRGEIASYDVTENALTAQVLPWALAKYGWPMEAEAHPLGDHTPVWIKHEPRTPAGALLPASNELLEIRFNPRLLAEAWRRDRGGRVESRTHSAAALTAQARVAAPGKGVRVKLLGSANKVLRYQQLRGDLAEKALRASRE